MYNIRPCPSQAVSNKHGCRALLPAETAIAAAVAKASCLTRDTMWTDCYVEAALVMKLNQDRGSIMNYVAALVMLVYSFEGTLFLPRTLERSVQGSVSDDFAAHFMLLQHLEGGLILSRVFLSRVLIKWSSFSPT